MRRRAYLGLCGATLVSAGCLSIGNVGADTTGRGRSPTGGARSENEHGSEEEEDGPAERGLEYYRHERGDWFRLADETITARVLRTDRMAPEDFGKRGNDIYVIGLRVVNQTDEQTPLDHEQFWVEALGQGEPPDTSASRQLEWGATGDVTRLEPEENRELKLAFGVPDEIEPAYLWIRQHYICLVPTES
jgi:hypothetical protein